uniref:Uncharacterized protein n=1 Tax=viral metagenome TaxID=1070528 RepID=A0A6C0D3L5_9ZZZZ
MSSAEDKSKNTQAPVSVQAVKPSLQETIIRDEVAVKKCCNIVKTDVHICCKCCAYSWAFSLNSIECCCVGLSGLCLAMSKCAIGCKDCLERIDCDGH